MNELFIHLRKDLKMLTSDSLFVVLMLALGVIAFVVGLTTCMTYISGGFGGWTDIVTRASIAQSQRNALSSYWSSIGNIYAMVFLITAAMALSGEKESGMSKYILTFRVRKPMFYLSKMVVLVLIASVALVVALVAYLVVFSVMDLPMLDLPILGASILFPWLSMVAFASLGLAISTLSSKKAAVIGVAVVVFFALSILSGVSYYAGVGAALHVNPQAQVNNYTEFMPVEYKLLIYSNPMVLMQGTSYVLGVDNYQAKLFDPSMGMLIATIQIALLTGLGAMSFWRERRDRSLFGALLSMVKRSTLDRGQGS